MPHIELDMETALPPEKIIAMLTDFSDRRPEIWPGLWEGYYEVYSVGETSAEVREGNKSPKVWAREHYDWSIPGTVRWTVVESNFSKPGSFVEARVEGKAGGGSKVHITWERSASSFMGKIALGVIVLTKGAPVRASVNKAFAKALAGGV